MTLPPTGKEGYCSQALFALLTEKKEGIFQESFASNSRLSDVGRFQVAPENRNSRCEE